jgi:hypothetical protein
MKIDSGIIEKWAKSKSHTLLVDDYVISLLEESFLSYDNYISGFKRINSILERNASPASIKLIVTVLNRIELFNVLDDRTKTIESIPISRHDLEQIVKIGSAGKLSPGQYSKDQLESYLKISINLANSHSTYKSFDQHCLFPFFGARVISREISPSVNFYFQTLSCMDIINREANSQFCRDFAETVMKNSYEDGFPVGGLLFSCGCYANQRNIVTGLLYILGVLPLSISNPLPSDIFYYLLTSISKCIRAFNIPTLQKEFHLKYSSIIKDVYQKRIFDFTNFFGMALDSDVTQIVGKYLRENWQEITENNEFIQWISLIEAIFKVHGKDAEIQFYLDHFFKFVDVSTYNRLTYKIDPRELRSQFTHQMKTAMSARFPEDVKYDIKNVEYIAGRILDVSVLHDNILELIIPFINIDYFIQSNSFSDFNISEFKGKLEKWLYKNTTELIVLFVSDRRLFQYSLNGIGEENLTQTPWEGRRSGPKWEKYSEFDTKHANEEWELDEEKRVLQLSRTELQWFTPDFSSKKKKVILGYSISDFPSNMMVDKTGKYLTEVCESSESISIDFLDQIKIEVKGIESWVPTESQDVALNYLSTMLSDSFSKWDVPLNNRSKLMESENEVIVLAAHGNKETSWTHYLYSATGSVGIIDDVKKGLRNKKLIILLACFSGKGEQEHVGNTISSLIRSLFEIGCQAIIAPKWALHIDVAKTWTSIYLDCFNQGRSSFDSFRVAQSHVMNVYPAPGAWACLHYFGNENIYFKS